METGTHSNNNNSQQRFIIAITKGDLDAVQKDISQKIVNTPVYQHICSDQNSSIFKACEYPLHIAMQQEKFYYTSHTRKIVPEIITLLLKHGADPNQPYINNITMPLHVAVKRNQPNIIKELLEYGANKETIDENGKTAYELAQEYRHTKEIINLLCPDTIKEKKQIILIHRMKCIQSLILLIAIFLYGCSI